MEIAIFASFLFGLVSGFSMAHWYWIRSYRGKQTQNPITPVDFTLRWFQTKNPHFGGISPLMYLNGSTDRHRTRKFVRFIEDAIENNKVERIKS